MKRLLIVCTLGIFIAGFVRGFSQMWYASGLFLGRFRAQTKDERMTLLRRIGMKTSPLRVRDILIAAYPDEPPDEHELAHLIGETAYAREGAKGFRYCDASFTYACFHGVIFGAIKANGYDETVLKGLADACNASGKNDVAKVSCAHGIGHGIMWVKNYDVLSSYQVCDRIVADEKLRFFCWDGVSMENVVRRGEMARGLSPVPWKSDDLYFPCDSIPVAYQAACVREQLFPLRLMVFNRDTQKSSNFCMYFPRDETRRECFGALGGALNQDKPDDPDYIIGECLQVPAPYGTYCMGRAASVYAYAGNKRAGQYVCANISGGQARLGCMKAVEAAAGALYMVQFP